MNGGGSGSHSRTMTPAQHSLRARRGHDSTARSTHPSRRCERGQSAPLGSRSQASQHCTKATILWYEQSGAIDAETTPPPSPHGAPAERGRAGVARPARRRARRGGPHNNLAETAATTATTATTGAPDNSKSNGATERQR
eukprot:4035917-Alexandrium_andersonii.AAC.1